MQIQFQFQVNYRPQQMTSSDPFRWPNRNHCVKHLNSRSCFLAMSLTQPTVREIIP